MGHKTKVISVIGAGGKTTLCKLIAKLNFGKKILITTTTKIFIPEEPDMNLHIGDIRSIDNKYNIITAGKKVISDNKLEGYTIDEIDDLANSNLFDIIIVEADGANRKSIKAPGINEPVIPINTNIIIGVIGLDSIGKRANSDNVHRIDEFLEVIDGRENQLITIDNIVSVINNKNGMFKNCSELVKKAVILNKKDTIDIKQIEEINNIIQSGVIKYKTYICSLKSVLEEVSI